MSSKPTSGNKELLRLAAWAAFLLVVLLLAYQRWPDGDWLKTGFDTLLPGSSDNHWLSKANQQSSSMFEGQLLLMVEGPATRHGEIVDLLDRAQKALVDARYVDDGFEAGQVQRWQSLVQALFPHRHGLLTREDVVLLEEDPGKLLNQYSRKLYSPLGVSLLNSLRTDPAGLFNDFIQSSIPEQMSPVTAEPDLDTMFEFSLLRVRQDRLGFSDLAGLYKTYSSLKENALASGMTLRATGVPLYSAYGVQSGQKELSTIGAASFSLLIILLLLVLRSLSGLFLSLLCVSTALLSGLLLTISLLGEIHILTLVFGATLIGIAVDYAFHYLAHSLMPGWCRDEALNKVFRGLSLGLLSSSLAFCVLLFLPFPGIRQIGLFMVAGLLGAWLTVCLLFPAIYRKPNRHGLPTFCYRPRIALRRRVPALILLMALIVPGLLSLEARDDVRDFYSAPQALQEDGEAISQRMGGNQETRYFLLQANSVQELLELEESLLATNDARGKSERSVMLTGITRLIPSIATQQSNFEHTVNLVSDRVFSEHLEQIGLSSRDQLAIQSETSTNFNPATPELIDGMDLPVGAGGFLGCDPLGCASWVQVIGTPKPGTLSALADEFEGVLLIDQLGDINQLMRRYRVAILYVLMAGVAIAGVLISMVAGWRRGTSIMMLPILACLLSTTFTGYMIGTWTIINALAMFLVIGVSLDFAIFRAFTPVKEQAATSLAITLSAATSILAFGMLGFSSTLLISTFGLSITTGLLFAYALSWLKFDVNDE